MTSTIKRKSMLILAGRNPKLMRGGASTWMLNIDPYFQKDYRVHYLVISDKWQKILSIPDRLKASIQTLLFLLKERNKWDIIFAHSPELAYIATLFSKNVVYVAHGDTNPMTNPTFRIGKAFYHLFEFFNRKIEEKARILLTVGEAKEGYIKIDQPIKHSTPPLIYNKKRGIIFVGRIEKIKNLDFIVYAYSKLSPSVKESHHLYIYGQGTREKEVRKIVNDLGLEKFVKFGGHISNHNVIQRINESALLVIASSFEGFPMVVAEALTVGTPVVSTSVGSIPNVIKSNYNGFCLPLTASEEVYASHIEAALLNIKSLSENSLISSRIFNVSSIYKTIKSEMDKHL